jgi:hypothetical protein
MPCLMAPVQFDAETVFISLNWGLTSELTGIQNKTNLYDINLLIILQRWAYTLPVFQLNLPLHAWIKAVRPIVQRRFISKGRLTRLRHGYYHGPSLRLYSGHYDYFI